MLDPPVAGAAGEYASLTEAQLDRQWRDGQHILAGKVGTVLVVADLTGQDVPADQPELVAACVRAVIVAPERGRTVSVNAAELCNAGGLFLAAAAGGVCLGGLSRSLICRLRHGKFTARFCGLGGHACAVTGRGNARRWCMRSGDGCWRIEVRAYALCLRTDVVHVRSARGADPGKLPTGPGWACVHCWSAGRIGETRESATRVVTAAP